MAVDLGGVALHLVEYVNFALVAEEHLRSRRPNDGGNERGQACVGAEKRTIIALTRVSPTCSKDPAFWARAELTVASPRASRDERIMAEVVTGGVEPQVIID